VVYSRMYFDFVSRLNSLYNCYSAKEICPAYLQNVIFM